VNVIAYEPEEGKANAFSNWSRVVPMNVRFGHEAAKADVGRTLARRTSNEQLLQDVNVMFFFRAPNAA
jgi:hypothetical protein